jgi:hypothetical protein
VGCAALLAGLYFAKRHSRSFSLARFVPPHVVIGARIPQSFTFLDREDLEYS